MKLNKNSIDPKLILELRKNLLSWFHKNKRELPFRINKNAYRIWVSEIMLQQTRVTAMLPIYETFLKRFPDPNSLSEASEEEVMKYWKGLGYYSRAKNLKKGARLLVEKYQSRFPENYEEALLIPGVGSYTASAVLSIAYGKPHAVLDGNVKRVLSRLFLVESDPSLTSTNQTLADLAKEFLTPQSPGDHNEAVMELGALVCVPIPNCSACPLQNHCEARSVGKEKEIPASKSVENWIDLDLNFLFLKSEDKVLLVKYTTRRFFKTIYSLPFRLEGKHPYEKDEWIEELFEDSRIVPNFLQTKHSITNHRIRLKFCDLYEKNISKVEKNLKKNKHIEFKWVPESELKEEFPSSISGKLIKLRNKNKKQPELPVGKL
ncbi:A/G-specific adenine glycosylase [Leptospira interrogans]|uniref:A/G-specific adenine glycosylase n=4 Tax=Leptospira interrogans TaxID=173 RepID=A0AAP9WAF3_LEPIR|nr:MULTISPECIES: A/G-specific adenine glycosylase [Leptospira]APH41489.1 A/G-specific adenine glycosylase [Leptospira interrogans serovar Copenhageni/Icterohaemorrhagiae]KAA1267251.1 A/G-specific adenine glycosylase [Leptospira interrogans serovar Weerasinghe]KAA1292149.1 A/G-specific adenine glycosylase [Leptospira interrogans serovar Geyaweera]AAS70209.1 A/G specific adenine glycosylase [Leptospira interrogans serovar Copenhageni str. Fiocruz L1-130]ARB97536.1 A/G-specific adenine glycosylas